MAKDDELTILLLETVPLLMGDLRDRMAKQAVGEHARLSFEHHRVLWYVGRHDGASLSQVATALGLSMPAASKAVQALVEDELIARDVSPEDRRLVRLSIGPKAKLRWEQARAIARESLGERLRGLTRDEREQLAAGLRAVRRVLASE